MAALPDKVPTMTDLASARTHARRLLLLSRGIHIIMAGAFVLLCVWLPMMLAIKPAYVTVTAGLGLPLFYCIQIAVQRWRRAHGINFTMPGDLSGLRPGSAEFRRSISVLLGLSLLGAGLGLLMGWLIARQDTQLFDYAVVAFLVVIGLNVMWFWRNARAWETWVLGAALLAASALIALSGLERGVWLSLLVMGTLCTLAGISLEIRWVNWVGSTRHQVGENVAEGAQP